MAVKTASAKSTSTSLSSHTSTKSTIACASRTLITTSATTTSSIRTIKTSITASSSTASISNLTSTTTTTTTTSTAAKPLATDAITIGTTITASPATTSSSTTSLKSFQRGASSCGRSLLTRSLSHGSTFRLFSILLCVLLLAETHPVAASDDEERLVRDLFRDYNKLIRPVEVLNMTVEVEFRLSFIQLINVNEKNQIMTSNVWLQLKWADYQLRWDEADYGGISVLRLPPDKVWKPDIVLFNNADGNYEVRYKSNILIYPGGSIMWVPPAIYQSSCTIDVTYFPFDQQKCVMKFGSWTYNGDQVSLKLEQDNFWVDLSDYWKSGTWDIVEVPAFLNVHDNSKAGKPTETDISFYITIRRKTLFYTVNLILPTVLISFLCILVFYLPAEAGEKVTLGISILLSLVVFLLLVSKILPPTSLVLPLIAKYLLFTFLMNTMSILVTVIIINWNFRGPRTHRMPNWIRILFLTYLPTILLMKRPSKTRLRWMMDMPGLGVHHHHFRPQCNIKANKMTDFELAEVHSELHHPNCMQNRDKTNKVVPTNNAASAADNTNQAHTDSVQTDLVYLCPDALRAIEAIDFIAEHLRCEDEYVQIREDWKYVAMVIDRLQLYIFFAVTAAGTMGILLDAPHIFQFVDQDKVISMHKKSTA